MKKRLLVAIVIMALALALLPVNLFAVTAGEAEALQTAKDFLARSPFSKQGLIEQLLYEGFTRPEAEYGVKNCGANWNEQAVNQAKAYLGYAPFSKQGLISRLLYEKFSQAESEYGANNCGASWCEEAIRAAKEYKGYGYSRDDIEWLLLNEKFTQSQTDFGVGIAFGDFSESINAGKVSISNISSKAFSGKAVTQNPVVKRYDYTLVKGTDYTLQYQDNIAPGSIASVTIQGKGFFTGSKTEKFRICFTDVPLTHSYQKDIYWAVDEGIAAGYGKSTGKYGKFGVADNITRGQVVMFLWRAAGKPAPKGNAQTFDDVPTSHSFYKAIQWAYEKNITTGYYKTIESNGPWILNTNSKLIHVPSCHSASKIMPWNGASSTETLSALKSKGYRGCNNCNPHDDVVLVFGVSDNCTRGQIVTFLWRYAGRPAPKGSTQTFSDVPTTHSFYEAIQWASEQKITSGFSDGSFGVTKTCTRGQCMRFLSRLLH